MPNSSDSIYSQPEIPAPILNESGIEDAFIEKLRSLKYTIRPDIRRMGGNRSNNSDITALTKTIVEINEVLPDEIPTRERINQDLQEMYYNLDSAYYELVKGSTGSGNQLRILTNTNKAPNSLANRIPKKEGRIRKNLLGKRVRHMMRSVNNNGRQQVTAL